MLITNKKIKEYNIIKKYCAGMVLLGWEVKSLKIFNNIEMKNSFITNIKNEIFLKNFYIYNKKINYKNKRNIKLLLKKIEIKNLIKEMKNFKIIPLNIFLKKNIIKIEIIVVLKKLLIKNEKNYKKKIQE